MGQVLTLANDCFRVVSLAQLRTRLKRRELDPAEIDGAIARLKAGRTLNDGRVALAIARMESAIKHRGRSRVAQPGGAKNSSAIPSGSRKLRPEP